MNSDTIKNNLVYNRECPKCKNMILYSLPSNFYRARKNNTQCKSCSNEGKLPSDDAREKMSVSKLGDKNPKYWLGKKRHPVSEKTIIKMQMSALKRYENDEERIKMQIDASERYKNVDERTKISIAVKLAMHRPDVRKRHIEALHQSKWLKVRTDKGQLEMINCWNKLGFNFEPNYQVHTDVDLFYIDGYDKEKNVVLEYDSEYHNRPYQKKMDEIRQQKIINILNPKKFWRYDLVNKICKNVV